MKMNEKDMLHMAVNDGGQNCAGCESIKKYDYGKKIYYCDHPGRIDDMGKLGIDGLPGVKPEWCPLMRNG